MRTRLLISIAATLSVIFLPYWVYLPILLLAIVIFPFYWEAVLIGFLIDILHGRGITPLPSLLSPAAFLSALVIIILLPLRERLRFNVSR